MAIQPTRPEAYDTGTLNQYAHIYDVQAEEKRARIAEETEEAARIAADDAEKQARIEADDAEKQARIAADDAEKQARIAADDAEKQARIAADDTEKQARIAADDAINELINSKLKVLDGYDKTAGLTNGIYDLVSNNHHNLFIVDTTSNIFTDYALRISVDNSGGYNLSGKNIDSGYSIDFLKTNKGDSFNNISSAHLSNVLLSNIVKASQDIFGLIKGSDSITIADGVAKVNSSIFGDGLTTTDGKVSVDTGFVGEHLAGDALYYDSTDGLMVKTGAGLHIDNDTLSVDQDTLPLASAENRGTVKVGKGLTISTDGALSTSGNLIYGTLATDAALLSDGVKSVVLSTIFDPSNTYLLHARITVVPKSTFAVGTKMTVSTSPIVPRFFHQLVEFFKRNTMCAAITISGSSIYTINNEGFDVTFKDANGILDFTVSMTNATLSPTQNLVIGSYY